MNESNREQEILIAMRRTLAAIVRDVTPPPGMRHPLADATIQEIRACLGLIAARERELADEHGQTRGRPRYVDEARTGQPVPVPDWTPREGGGHEAS